MTGESATKIRVVLVDDHDILRQGLKLLLEGQPDIEVVGEARTGTEAIALTQQLIPDVVVLDISMPDTDGLQTCRQLRASQTAMQVLMLTMHESEEYFLQALRVGAAGYLVKKAAPADLSAAVRAVAHGGAFLYPGLAKALIRAYLAPSVTATTDVAAEIDQVETLSEALHVLTPREIEVLKLVAEGHTNQEIADRLVISIKTVQAHRANMMEKLGLHDVAHLVRFAIRHKLLTPEF